MSSVLYKEKQQMKLVVGMGNIEDFVAFVDASADEIFVGYAPQFYYEKYKNLLPANRREVAFYHVQLHSLGDMMILSKMMKAKKIPVSIAFNSLYYSEEQKQDLLCILMQLLELGFDRFIVSDIGFVQYLKEKGVHVKLEISGEIGENNHRQIAWLVQNYGQKPGISRIIFQRKTSLSDMKRMITFARHSQISLEWEAFLMNENCQYSGGYCNSMHCDEMCHICLLPYEVKGLHGEKVAIPEDSIETVFQKNVEESQCEMTGETEESEDSLCGSSGCGLCALFRLQEAGITHLKLVGRGLSPTEMLRDIGVTRRALKLLQNATTEEDFIQAIKKKLFPNGCSGNCYYPEIKGD